MRQKGLGRVERSRELQNGGFGFKNFQIKVFSEKSHEIQKGILRVKRFSKSKEGASKGFSAVQGRLERDDDERRGVDLREEFVRDREQRQIVGWKEQQSKGNK